MDIKEHFSLEPKWEAKEPGKLNLVGTELFILYRSGHFHIHHRGSCLGVTPSLGHAKRYALTEVLPSLVEMGIEI